MWWVLHFIFGLIAGSFLNVIAKRYDSELPLFGAKTLGGRSRCPSCGTTLTWFELIPLVSFILQGGRCRSCRGKISLEYPLVELLSGLIFVFVPARIFSLFFPFYGDAQIVSLAVLASLWTFVFLVLLLMSLIDFRLHLIPDEVHILLGLAGIAIAYVASPLFFRGTSSFVGPYAFLFGMQDIVVINRIVGSFTLALLFGVVFLVTRGEGMGMGDVKLATALGLVFGWPDGLLLSSFAFILGAIVGVSLLVARRAEWRSAVPFGPFLALGAIVCVLFGEAILAAYMSTLPFFL